jgi:16S rRNA pseudouridine516 synthase
MKLVKHLGNLGYGTRREVSQMVARRRVTRRDGHVLAEGDPFIHDDVLVDGEPLDPPPGTVIVLHKPVGYVCSTTDNNLLVYQLLPHRFRARSPIIAPVGRLDRDTSGLLLLTDDGPLNHRITAPRTHLPKTYEARLATDLRGDEGELFAAGTMMLESEATPLLPASLEILSPRQARLTITEGRYHQVRRMFAAVGNHVEALHRVAIGPLTLGDLPSGRWRPLAPAEQQSLRDALISPRRPSPPTAP